MGNPNDRRLRLAVCDDEPDCCRRIAEQARQLLAQDGLEADIDCYHTGQALLDAMEGSAPYSILLLDVMMEGKDGMTLAATLRAQGKKLPIIFVSSNREMALKGYEVGAARYLAKPVEEAKLREALRHCRQLLGTGLELLLPTASGQHRIRAASILYAETYGRGLRIAMEDGFLESHLKISALAAMLPEEQYLLCHRTILVNLDWVTSLRRCELELKNGTRLPISKYRLAELRNRLLQYLER